MCHHYTVAEFLDPGFVYEFGFGAPEREEVALAASALPARGAWPLKRVAALRVGPEGEIQAFAPEWGLLPRWWKPSDRAPRRAAMQRKTINARCETAAEKPSYREAWRKRRCLLPVDSFFERGHTFRLPAGDEGAEPTAFAGLWEPWLGEEGEVLTATLLTTEPCAEVRSVGHHRMPVLLNTPEERARWLTEGATGPDDPLMRPTPDGLLRAEPAPPRADK